MNYIYLLLKWPVLNFGFDLLWLYDIVYFDGCYIGYYGDYGNMFLIDVKVQFHFTIFLNDCSFFIYH